MVLDVSMPTSWRECSQKQLRAVFRLMAEGHSAEELKCLFFLRFSGLSVVGKRRSLRHGGHLSARRGVFIFRRKRDFFELSSESIAEFLPLLDFVLDIPSSPVALEFKGRPHVDSLLRGVPFESFLVIENLYQGYLATQREDFLLDIADILYPRPRGLRRLWPFRPWFMRRHRSAFCLSVFFWVASLKGFLASRFPDLFQPAASAQSTGNLLQEKRDLGEVLSEGVDAQLRALTKGDVTKEEQILALDCWRALTELNAMAAEAARLKAVSSGRR